MTSDVYELYALKYAEFDRTARQNFVFQDAFEGQDIHDGPMPLDYFVWAAVSKSRTFVIDIGFDEATGARRNRTILRNPADALGLLGIEADKVPEVILTHMHYDHIGNFQPFGNAVFHLQDREMAYATGRYMAHRRLRMPFDVGAVTDLVRLVHGERVMFHDGDAELAPGLSVHLIGGHSHGMQVVRVNTRRGVVVLASDASHFYAHMETGNPFPLVLHVGDMLEGHRTCRRLAESGAHVIPGHDPLVMRRYPAPSPELEGIAVRLDAAPAG